MVMKRTVLIFLGILIWQLIFAKQIRFDCFDISTGLSQNNINAMEFDDLGNLWVGTLDGLNRFNGYSFEIIKPGRSIRGQLSSNHIVTLGKGTNGDMWIVTRDGNLNYYNASRNQYEIISKTFFDQFNFSQTRSILQLNDSVLFLCNYNIVGVWEINKKHFTTIQTHAGIRGIKTINEKTVVYGDFGIQQLVNENDEYASQPLNTTPCYAIHSYKGQYHALSDKGIESINSNFEIMKILVGSDLFHRNNIDFKQINEMVFDGESFWIGGYDFLGCFCNENGSYYFQQFSYDQQISHSFKGYAVTKLSVDQAGNIWIGTSKNGINLVNRRKNQFDYHEWDNQKLLDAESNPVRAICKTKSGELWLGFDRKGIGVVYPNGKQAYFSHYYTMNGDVEEITNVRIIFEDSQNNLWIGEGNNLCCFNRKRERVETIDQHFNFAWPFRCYSVKELDYGTVTISSPLNVGFVNLESKRVSTISAQYINESIRDFVQDKYRNFWIAKNDRGLLKINYPNLENTAIDHENFGLSDNKVYCLAISSDSLWVGTNSGLNLIDLKTNKVINQYFEEDGLCNNIVYSISIDKNRNLWMSTNRGIAHFMVHENRFRTFLSNDYFMDDAHFVDQEGIIYYGGYTGVVSFNPKQIKDETIATSLKLESLSILNRPVYAGDTLEGRVVFQQPLWLTKSIKLHHRLNNISLVFNAYPFQIPNTSRFRYRMLGLQEQWIEAGKERSANYTKVPPGEYRFQVQTASDQMGFGASCELKISIIPPFWMTIWFKVLLLSILALSIVFIFINRIKQIKNRNEWLKKKVDEQTAELRDQNRTILEISEELQQANESRLRFFTNISHEFRTPLTIILGHIENLEHQSKNAVIAIQKNALRLLQLIDQTIDLRKMDQEKLNISCSEFDLVSFIYEIIQSIEVVAQQKNVKVLYNNQIPAINVCLDTDMMEKILYNLLSNAIKFSLPNQIIKVETEALHNEVRIRISDQGVGISEHDLGQIFDRFYRVEKGNQSTSGYGIGLALVKGLVETQKGSIDVKSELNKGTTFTIILPLIAGEAVNSSIARTTNFHDLFPRQSTINTNEQEIISSKKIMIVEDNPDLLEFLSGILSKKYNINTAANGSVALEQLQHYTPDLIVSDIMMPVMDGLTFCREVKSAMATSHIPFILLTAKTGIDDKIEGFEMGIDDYIEKPFNSKVLISRIDALLSNRQKLIDEYINTAKAIPRLNHISTNNREFLQHVDENIATNLGNTAFTVDLLSEKLNMSRASFYRKFTDLTGNTPADYIRKIRLRNAHQLLKTTNLSVSEIAEKSGFQSVGHFRKSFKNEFNKTPSETQKGC